MQDTEINTIADVPSDYALVQDQTEIQDILTHVGATDYIQHTACMFVQVGNGEYTDILISRYFVPMMTHRVERVVF